MTTEPAQWLDSSRDLYLVPTVWRQRLLNRNPQNAPHEARRLSIHAEAHWPDGWTWFNEYVSGDVLFEIEILSQTTALQRQGDRSDEWKGTVGALHYHGDEQNSGGAATLNPFVGGVFWVPDAMFEDVWERAKLGAVERCEIHLEVLGLEIDLSPLLKDRWNVKQQPKLTVVGVELCFTTGPSGLRRSGPTPEK